MLRLRGLALLTLLVSAQAQADASIELTGKVYAVKPRVFVLEIGKDQGLEIPREALDERTNSTLALNQEITVDVRPRQLRAVRLPLEPRDPVRED
jgi:hypothetical protein